MTETKNRFSFQRRKPRHLRSELEQTHQIIYDYHVYFEIEGFSAHPNEITKHTGLIPKRAIAAGERIHGPITHRFIRINDSNRWQYEIKSRRGADIEDQFRILLNSLSPYMNYFLELEGGADVKRRFQVYGYSHNVSGQTGIVLDETLITTIASFKASFYSDIIFRRSFEGLIPYHIDRILSVINRRYFTFYTDDEIKTKP